MFVTYYVVFDWSTEEVGDAMNHFYNKAFLQESPKTTLSFLGFFHYLVYGDSRHEHRDGGEDAKGEFIRVRVRYLGLVLMISGFGMLIGYLFHGAHSTESLRVIISKRHEYVIVGQQAAIERVIRCRRKNFHFEWTVEASHYASTR